MEENDANLLQKIISLIYCRSISSSFRKPIDTSTLKNKSQISMIKYPMDLGTLLSAIMKRKLKISNYRDGLRLVFTNSITVHKDNEKEINLAKHLDSFACRLFEDSFHLPYRAVIPRDDFMRRRNSDHTYNDALAAAFTDVNSILEVVKTTSESLRLLTRRFIDGGATVIDTRPTIWHFLRPLLAIIKDSIPQFDIFDVNVFANILTEYKLPAILILLSEAGFLQRKRSPVSTNDKAGSILALVAKPECAQLYAFLHILDINFCILLACVHERTTRGHESSSVWATPLTCAVTVAENRPVIVLTSLICVGTLTECSAINIGRLPAEVRNELNVLAKDVDSNQGNFECVQDCLEPIADPQLNIPSGYSLVEYLDDHEFGWLMEEEMQLVMPMESPVKVGKELAAVCTWLSNKVDLLMDNYGLLSKENELLIRSAGILLDEPAPSIEELDGYQKPKSHKEGKEYLNVGDAALAGIELSSSSSSSSVVAKQLKSLKERSSKAARVSSSRKAAAKPAMPSTSSFTDEESGPTDPVEEGKVKVIGQIDGVPLHHLYQKGLFLASRCPRNPALSKRDSSVQRCKFFGAWAENHRVLKEGHAKGAFPDIIISQSDPPLVVPKSAVVKSVAAKSSRKKPESATVARPTAVALTEIAVESSVGIETEEANLADATLPAVMKPVVVRRPAKRGRYEIIKEVAEDGRSTITRIFTEADIPAIPSVKKLPPKINSQALSSRVSAIDEVKTKLTRKKRRKGPPTAQAIDASANVQAKPLGRPKGTPSLAVNIDGLTSGALFDHPNGCSQYISGEGVIHTRSVNTAAPVFMRENPNRELRKALLRRDLTAIREAVVNLNAELLRHRASTTEEESLDHDRIDDFSGEQA